MKKILIACCVSYGAVITIFLISLFLFAGWLLGAPYITRELIHSVSQIGIIICIISRLLGFIAKKLVKKAEREGNIW